MGCFERRHKSLTMMPVLVIVVQSILYRETPVNAAAVYNRGQLNFRWTLLSLPATFAGRTILEQADTNRDLTLDDQEADAVDWPGFVQEVMAFQAVHSIVPEDGKLGPMTLARLVDGHAFPAPDPMSLKRLPIHTRMMRIAESQMGVRDIYGVKSHPIIEKYAKETGISLFGRGDDTAWCSIFMNWCALIAGAEKSSSEKARSWSGKGRPRGLPRRGDIVVFWRENIGGNLGHVALFHSYAANGAINVLGGNQEDLGDNRGDSVCTWPYPVDRILDFRELGPV